MTRNNFDGGPIPSPDRRQRSHSRALGLAGIAVVALTALHGLSPVQAETYPRSAPSGVPSSGQNNGGGTSVDLTQSAPQVQHVLELRTPRVQKNAGGRHSQVVQAPDQGHHFVREGGRLRRADTHDTLHASTFSEPKMAGQKANAVQVRAQAREQQLRQTAWIQKTVNDVRAVDTAIQSVLPGIDTGVESVLYALGGDDVDERATLQTTLELAGQNLIYGGSEVARIASTSKGPTLESLVGQLAVGDFSHLHGTQFEKFGELARTLSKSDRLVLQSFLLDASTLIEKSGTNAELLSAGLIDLYEEKGLSLFAVSLALFSLGVAGVRNKRALAPIVVAAGTLLSACGGPAPAAEVPIVETAPAATSTPLAIESNATVTGDPEQAIERTNNSLDTQTFLEWGAKYKAPDKSVNEYWGYSEGTIPETPAQVLAYRASEIKGVGGLGNVGDNVARFLLNETFDPSVLTDLTVNEGKIVLDGHQVNPIAPVAIIGSAQNGDTLISFVTFGAVPEEDEVYNAWVTSRQLGDILSQSSAEVITNDGAIIAVRVLDENGEVQTVTINQFDEDLTTSLMSPDAASTSALTPTPEPTATATITPALESTATPVSTYTPVPTEMPTAVPTDTPQTIEEWAQSTPPSETLIEPEIQKISNALGIPIDDVQTRIDIRNRGNGTYAVVVDENTGITLLVADSEHGRFEWEIPTPGKYWSLNGKHIGGHFNGDEWKMSRPSIVSLFSNGGVIGLLGQVRPGPDIEERPPRNAESYLRTAKEIGVGFVFNYVVEPGKFPAGVNTSNVDLWLTERLNGVADEIVKNNPRELVYIQFNEATADGTGWNPENNPLRDKYGDNWLGKYLYNALSIPMLKGLAPNQDFVTLINENGMLIPSSQDFVHDQIVTAREFAFGRLMSDPELAEKLVTLGITKPSDIRVVLGSQTYVNLDGRPANGINFFGDPTIEQLNALGNRFADTGGVLLTEVAPHGNDEQKALFLTKLTQAVMSNPNLRGVVLWNLFKNPSDADDDYMQSPTLLLNPDGQPTSLYYALMGEN